MKPQLLRWYRAHKRAMPWRDLVTPYRTWISEVMLQQTTVAAVAPRYEAFIKRFPDPRAVAAASEPEVLRHWAGLGYYSRARNLRKAAQRIVSEHGGEFPSAFEDVLALPGIGRYTAGAILSIAFGQPHPIVDGNVMRVLSRWLALKADIKTPAAAKILWERAEQLLDRRSPGDWNQALMELGATICLPEAPRCGACPVAGSCRARALGAQDTLPVSGPRKAPVSLRWTCLWIEERGRLLLWKRSESERFLPGHWGLPEARHLDAEPGALLRTIRHTITHHRIAVEVRRAAAPLALPAQAAWVPRGALKRRLVSSLWLKSARSSPL